MRKKYEWIWGLNFEKDALVWLLHKALVTAPIIGATKISHLEDAVGAISVKPTPEEIAYLEEPYVPHGIVNHN